MTGTIALGANYYDTLGLEPGATEDQIRQAFAREMAMFRPMAETARIGLAFETLRNPARRRAYDESLGLNRRRATVAAPATLSLHMSARFDPPVAEKRASTPTAPSHEPEPSVAGTPTSAPVEQSEAPFIAAADDSADADLERLIGRLGAMRKASSTGPASESKRRRFDVNPAFAIGGLLVAAVTVGLWGGLHAGDTQEDAPVPASASVVLPPAKPLPKALVAPAAEAPLALAPEPQSASRLVPTEARRSRPIAQGSPRLVADAAAADSSAPSTAAGADRATATGAAEEAVAQPTPASATTTAAAMPLPNAIVARTIQRIGYSCGRVASTAAVEGEAAGTFKVTCSSGQSYQAKPVGGRYHFRRLSGQ